MSGGLECMDHWTDVRDILLLCIEKMVEGDVLSVGQEWKGRAG